MKKYALFFDRLELQNKPYLMSEGMEQSTRYVKTSDWYNHADDVTAAIEAKDREIADLRARLAAEQLDCGKWEVLADRRYARCGRAIDLAVMYRARLAAVRERCEANNWMGTARLCGEGVA